MVAVVMAEDDLGDTAQIDLQLAGVLQNRLGTRAGVKQDAMTGRLDQRREPPLTHPRPVGEHRREHDHFERLDLPRGGLGLKGSIRKRVALSLFFPG